MLLKRLHCIFVIPAMSGVVAGCGAYGIGSSSVPPKEGPVVNWDKPFFDGPQTSVAGARTAGRLPFLPSLPRLPRPPVRIQVTNPGTTPPEQRAVAIVYRFPIGPDFPTDGRVVVEESATGQTVAGLEATVEDPPGPAEDFRMIDVAGERALLSQHGGVGRVTFIRHGVTFDITGPAVSPAMAVRLARQV